MREEKMERKTKREWKKEIKTAIQKKVEEQWKGKSKEMKKMRHVRKGGYGMKEYLKETTTEKEKAGEYLRLKLKMR